MTEINLVEGYIPGALGRVTELHGQYYSEHWGFGLYFESQVAAGLSEFMERFDENQDGIWFATLNGSIEGSIAIDGYQAEAEGAHLRWYIVSDALRGTGVGSKLLNIAIQYCRKQKYKSLYLHTFAGLTAARHLYEKSGFKLVQESTGKQWGTEVNEQKFLLEIV